MAVGDSGRAEPSKVPGHGPQDASGKVGKHVKGSGMIPGTGPSAGPSSQDASNHNGNGATPGQR